MGNNCVVATYRRTTSVLSETAKTDIRMMGGSSNALLMGAQFYEEKVISEELGIVFPNRTAARQVA